MFEFPQPATALHRFAEDYHQAIQYAALRLGGRPYLRKAQRVLDDLRELGPISSRTEHDTYELLMLFVQGGGLIDIETDCVPDLGAGDLDDIALLAEALSDALLELKKPFWQRQNGERRARDE